MNTQLHTKNLLVKTIQKLVGDNKIDVKPTDSGNLEIWVQDACMYRHYFTVPPYEKGFHQRFTYDGLFGSRILNNDSLDSGDFIEALVNTVNEAGYMWECESYVESIIYKERN